MKACATWRILSVLAVSSVFLAFAAVCVAEGSFLPTPGLVFAYKVIPRQLGAIIATATSIDSVLWFALLWAGYAAFRWLAHR
jgi:hypothetical protein